MTSGGGRFDFVDGGTYCGGWEDGKTHGHGVCTGPKGQGEYSGAWQYGFEISGVYTWPSGNHYEGQWFQGKRHGLGMETKGRWVYRGEWTQGFKGRYGVRQSTSSGARYEGTWTTGLQDGYGCETYADGATRTDQDREEEYGSYQGQWLRGMRHGHGVRKSVPYGLASHYRPKAIRDSLTSLRSENEDDQVVKNRDRKLDESRGGFVLKARSDETPPARRGSLFDRKGTGGGSLRKTIFSGLKLKKQKSTGDINDSPKRQTGSVRSTISNISHVSADSTQSGMTNASVYTDSTGNLSFVSQDDITDVNVTETYMGEWKNDKRSGYGISERSDGLKYQGEWYNNKKYGYGVTSFKDGTKEEGKYKNNVLISSGKKNKLFLIRTSKLRDRVDNAVLSAQRAAQIALQKADIAITRMANARAKAEQSEGPAQKARQDSDIARLKAKEYAPEFHQPGTDILKKKLQESNGEDLEEFKNVKMLQNHNPGVHTRSKSVMHRKTNRGEVDVEGLNGPSPITTLSSALDCALAGSRSKLGPPTGSYDAENTMAQLQVEPQLLNVNYHSPKGSAENMSTSTPTHSRSPSLKIRRYSFLAGSRRGRGFSELFNSTILNDHFDQYATHDEDCGMMPEFIVGDESKGNSASDTSPDSGVSDTMDDDSKTRPMQRRRTLPSIIKRNEDEEPKKQNLPEKETAHSNENIAKKDVETYIIENGIRKRLRAENKQHNPVLEHSGALPKAFRVESEKHLSRQNRGSLPDISNMKDTVSVMSREEAYKLSSARRSELRRLEELEEKRRQGDVTVILGDLKDWCQQRQLLVLVIALNVSLATMFFNLLS